MAKNTTKGVIKTPEYSHSAGLDANILYFVNKTPEKIINSNSTVTTPVPHVEIDSVSKLSTSALEQQLSFMDHMNPAAKVMAVSYVATLINQGADQRRIDSAIASFKIAAKEPVHNA